MNRNYLLLAASLLLLTQCQEASKDLVADDLHNEVSQLHTLEQKEAYLTKIFEEDQKVRGGTHDIVIMHGPDSEEMEAYKQRQWDQDDINLKKIEKYLELHGVPSTKDSLNYKAGTAIWAVIQHSDIEARERSFEKLYEAQLKGDFDLSWILDRMYRVKMQKKFVMPEDSKYDNEMDQMIFELGLEEKKHRVLAKMKSSS